MRTILARIAQASVLFLPAYSPDFNPIESLWSKVKQALKRQQPRNARQLFLAVVTPTDCPGFFLPARIRDMI